VVLLGGLGDLGERIFWRLGLLTGIAKGEHAIANH
jgi:hypothetical protein